MWTEFSMHGLSLSIPSPGPLLKQQELACPSTGPSRPQTTIKILFTDAWSSVSQRTKAFTLQLTTRILSVECFNVFVLKSGCAKSGRPVKGLFCFRVKGQALWLSAELEGESGRVGVGRWRPRVGHRWGGMPEQRRDRRFQLTALQLLLSVVLPSTKTVAKGTAP